MLRRRREPEPVDPLAHVRPDDAPARWRGAVRIALDHRRTFTELAAMLGAGPTQDRVTAISARVDAGVEAVWDLVQRGAVAEKALAATDPRLAADRLKDARRAQADRPDDPDLARQVDALAAAHASAQRLANSVEDLDDRLALVDARLGALVAAAAELAAGPAESEALRRAEHDLDAAVAELGATRSALDELRGL